VSFYNCDIAVIKNHESTVQTDEPIARCYNCSFSGERVGIDGFVYAIISSAGEMCFNNCEFLLNAVSENSRFAVMNVPCRFDGCTFGVVDGATAVAFATADCKGMFNNCHFDVNCSGQYPHLFLNPTKLVMQNCYVKTNGFAIESSGTKDASQILAVGCIFDRGNNEHDNVLHVGSNVTIADHSISLVNNTSINSTNDFVRNWSQENIVVVENANNKI
jgi:hypothetical protein